MSELQEIARACLKYSRKIVAFGSGRLPVVIRVIECGPTSTGQLQRLSAISPPSLMSKCRASALAVDTISGRVWSSSRLDKPERPFVEAMLRAPRQSDLDKMPYVTVKLPPRTAPLVALGLIGVMALIFLAELVFGVDPPGMLALVLSNQRRPDDAKEAAAAGCQDRSSPLFGRLQAARLCSNP
jgi:hypothetical protein